MTKGLEQVLEDYLRSAETGAAPSRDSFLAAHPHLAKELEEFLDGEDLLRGWIKTARSVALPDNLPCAFGSHRLLEEIGRGGMGVVFKAQAAGLDRHVALKVIRSARFASAAEVARFKLEAEAASQLDHPNIVPIYEFGEHEGQPYYTMKLIEGGSLQERLPAYREDPRAAARVMAEVARAVRYAHRRAILHRDLKPANILIDAEGRPHVTDFGLAKRMGGADEASGSGEIIGTLAYMAPEQVSGRKCRLSVSVDIHGMGAVLYALLTGQSPFEGGGSAEVLRKIQEHEPADPRTLNPKVDADLAAVCLKCLKKDPAQRYEIASDLAEDLESWLEDRPVRARHVGRVVRFWRWSRRHALQLALGLTAAALAGTLAVMALERAARQQDLEERRVQETQRQEQERRLREAEHAARRQEILKSNVYTADMVARVILSRLKEWGDHIGEVAKNKDLKDLLRARKEWGAHMKEVAKRAVPEELLRAKREGAGVDGKLRGFCDTLHKAKTEPTIINWHLLDSDGVMVGRTPPPGPGIIGETFAGRDYFSGTTKEHLVARGVHVSKVYRSRADNLYKFNLCVPVLNDDGGLLGVIGTAITTGPTLGIATLQDEKRQAVLVGPGDDFRYDNDPPPGGGHSYLVLVHPKYKQGDVAKGFDPEVLPARWDRGCPAELNEPGSDRVPAHKIGHSDPFSDRPQLAGFAPVGNTGFVVVVQQEDK